MSKVGRWQLALTSMPVASRIQVVSLADAPSQASGVPEDVPVLGDVSEDGSARRPLDGESHLVLVASVAVGVGGAQDVQRGTQHCLDGGSSSGELVKISLDNANC